MKLPFSPGLPPPESLPLAKQVAQMVVVRAAGHLFDHEIAYPAWEATAAQLERYLTLGVGGVILLGGSAAEVGLRSQTLQAQAEIPLLLAADVEEGVGQRFSGATWFPPPMALEAIAQRDLAYAVALAEQFGAATAQEALAIGLNWVLAPVVDVNNNPANPVINVRAYGRSPTLVRQLTTAFIRGAQTQPVLTSAKHFPGHGDTALDSHLELPLIDHSRARLEQVEFEPFRGAIAAGVDTVMTAHLQVPALDSQYPATLSAATLQLLRQELEFDGLIVTDALIMGALTRHYGPYEAAVLAVEAGADVLLMPADPEGAIAAVCEAVVTGRIAPARIAASVERLWRAKQKTCAGLGSLPETGHAWEHLPPPPVQLSQLAQPSVRQTAAAMLQASATICGHLAVAPGSPIGTGQATPASALPANILIVDDVLNCRFLGRTAPAIALPQQAGYSPQLVDSRCCRQLPRATQLRPSLLQLFIRGNPFRGSADLSQLAQTWLEALLQANCLQALVIYGSPYSFEQFRAALPEGLPYAFSYGQMPEAQAQVLTALLALPAAAAPDRTFTD